MTNKAAATYNVKYNLQFPAVPHAQNTLNSVKRVTSVVSHEWAPSKNG